MNLSQFKSFK